jgi:GNAT superfamily N-acetyltransferase
MLGVRGFLVEIPPWLLRRRYLFYGITPADARPLPSPPLPFRLDILLEQEIPDLVALRPDRYTPEGLLRRIHRGHLGLVGRSGTEIVHLRWVFVGAAWLPYLSRRLLLAPGEGLLDEVYTVPAWRRRGVETAAAQQTQRLLRARGFGRVLGVIASWNRAPLRLAERQGYQKLGEGGYWTLFGYRKFFWEGKVADGRGGLVVGE